MADTKQYTIYSGATDLQPGYAVREWVIGPGRVDKGPVLAQGLKSLADARDAVPAQADTCIHRAENDDPAIVETWI
jgi:hypothetical protein